MEKKFTPGPWTYSELWIWRPSQQMAQPSKQPQIAYVGYDQNDKGRMSEEQIANAHLMASAPDMLEALEDVVAMYDLAMAEIISSIDNNNETPGSKRMEYPEEQPQIAKAKAAINKAYGKE